MLISLYNTHRDVEEYQTSFVEENLNISDFLIEILSIYRENGVFVRDVIAGEFYIAIYLYSSNPGWAELYPRSQ